MAGATPAPDKVRPAAATYPDGVRPASCAAARTEAPEWLYAAGVMPSLIAFASGIPWMIGTTWPGPSLGWLGMGIAASVLVDRRLVRLGLVSHDYARLRMVLSVGLGALTLLLAVR